jgi:hypothetical protein
VFACADSVQITNLQTKVTGVRFASLFTKIKLENRGVLSHRLAGFFKP